MIKEFEQFTNTRTMRNIFQERLPGFAEKRYLITACHVLRTRYKTYANAQARHKSFLFIHYGLEVMDAATRTKGAQQLYAQVYLNGRSQLKYSQIKKPPLCPPQFGTALVHLPELGLIVWAFPNDPHLPHLPLAVNGEQIKGYLPYKQLPAGFNQPDKVADVRVEVVRYKPEVRCTLRYQLHRQPPNTAQTLTLFGKTYATHKGREVYHQIKSLWQQSSTHPRGFLIAKPYGYDETLQMVWQEALSGEPLSRRLSPANNESLLTLVAQGLVHLHQSRLSTSIEVNTADLLADVRENTAQLMQALPPFRERFGQLLAHLVQAEPGLTSISPALIHRDFHAKQLLVNNGLLAIFDFDDLATGDPLQDIAFFLVDLHFRELEPDQVARMGAIFCQAYQFYSGTPVPLDRLNWHIQLQFLVKAHWYYKKKQLSRRLKQHIERILVLAEGKMRSYV